MGADVGKAAELMVCAAMNIEWAPTELERAIRQGVCDVMAERASFFTRLGLLWLGCEEPATREDGLKLSIEYLRAGEGAGR